MTETTTPTDEVVDQSSSGTEDGAPLLGQDNEQGSAVEQKEDTGAGEQDSQASASNDSSSQGDGSEDAGLAKFAKSQGIDDVSTLTEREKSLLKAAHDNVKNYRKSAEEKANERKLNDEVDELTKPKEGDSEVQALKQQMARYEARNTTNEFWNKNQDDKQYESKMAEILAEERKNYGDAAAWALAQNLPRLLREAKAAAGAFDSDAARDAGRREERERLRKAQEGGADVAHASQGTSQGSPKIDRDWVENTYDPNNPEHQKKLDEAIQRGDLY